MSVVIQFWLNILLAPYDLLSTLEENIKKQWTLFVFKLE